MSEANYLQHERSELPEINYLAPMQILTIVIGIVVVLLLLSLLASRMRELLSSMFSLRGSHLVKALRNMLASSDKNEVLVDAFQHNSMYRHLTQQYGREQKGFSAPSYMSAATFQSILFDVILKGEPIENLEQKIQALPDEDLKNVLRQLLRESGGADGPVSVGSPELVQQCNGPGGRLVQALYPENSAVNGAGHCRII